MEFPWARRRQIINDPADAEDDHLVSLAKKNRAAFAPLFQRYAGRVYHYIYSRVGNVFEAEDLTSQVFIDAMAALPGYQPRGKFAGWLFTFAYRRCADYHRKPVTELLSEQFQAAEALNPDSLALRREMFQQLEQVLGELEEDELELLRQHYAGHLTYSEMAFVLGRSEEAIKMAMSRLINKMRTRWEEIYE